MLIEKALQLDDTLAEAHATRAFIRMFHHWDWVGAEQALDRALALNPNSAAAHHWRGVYLSLRGRLDEAKGEMHRALELDPPRDLTDEQPLPQQLSDHVPCLPFDH